MPSRKSAADMVPPDFVREAYLHDLPQELEGPLHLLFALRGCVQRVNADLVLWLGKDALSPGRMQMLMILRASRKPVAQRDLVTMLKVSRASVSELIETLVRDRLIVSKPDAAHGRRMLVQLTKSGRETADRLLKDNATRLRDSFAAIGDDELHQLIGMLDRLCVPS
ncbi:MarR family winged helix-turn-helix transcriptional regulator [Sphingomonas oryzagri]